jgi:hypothetical protein
LNQTSTCKDLFPDVLYKKPQVESPKWSLDSGIIVKRKTNPKEATVEAWGLVDGQPTGKHFSHQVYDDVVTLESRSRRLTRSPRRHGAWEMSLNLGSASARSAAISARATTSMTPTDHDGPRIGPAPQ